MSGLSSVNRIQLLAQQVATVAQDLLFPPHCANCKRVGSFLCPRCLSTVTQASERAISGLDGVQVSTHFTGVARVAIHAFKYDQQVRLAEPLGELLSQQLFQMTWPIDVVSAVPLHEIRLRERGYNQAALLAQYVAYACGWPFVPMAIRRVRETASQINLNAQERHANVAGAFVADADVVRGQSVLVIDDVLTTGATLLSCADALRVAGATRVYGAAVAGSAGDQSV